MTYSNHKLRLIIVLLALFVSAPVFAGADNCQVDFLEGEKAARLLTSEKSEPYFSRLKPLEIEAKTGGQVKTADIKEAREKVRNLYASSVLPFTREEMKFLTERVGNICRILEGRFGRIVQRTWKLVKTEPYIEGGLPHTREDGIVFSSAMIQKMMDSPPAFSEMILTHEILHVVQRKNRKLFTRLYEKKWNYRKVDSINGLPELLLSSQVINPDGVNYNWLVPDTNGSGWVWPRILIEPEPDDSVRMPEGFRFVAVNVEKKGGDFHVLQGQKSWDAITPIEQSVTLTRKFPGIERAYHPDEVSAKYFSKYFLLMRFGKLSEIEISKNSPLSQLVRMLETNF